jgi:tetratricopeptide (TPR) repeat protein
MGSRYFDNDNYDDALFCFQKAYNIEKENNNFEGLYYTSSYLAKLYAKSDTNKTLDFLLEAKKNAEFINDDYCILESMLALGDFYYNNADTLKKCLIEYIKALNLAEKLSLGNDIIKIKKRIDDMKLRIPSENFTDIENKYGKHN